MKKLARNQGKPAIDLLEEAVDMLRRCGLATWLCYYVGSVPFVLALLFFWSEMSAGAYAERSLPAEAIGMAGAFVWMRCWQSVFANRLLSFAGTQESLRWTPSRVLRLAVQQAFVQSSALFLLPLAALATLPFGWVYAFYQHFLIEGCGEAMPMRRIMDRAAAQSKLWPFQNHVGMGYLFLLTFVVFINALSLLWLAPQLVKTLLGIETLFSRNHLSLLNTTVLMIAAGIAYLVIGPVSKAFYALRCFYGRAVHTGEDLKVSLRQFRAVAVCILGAFLLLAGGTAHAVDAKQLDRSIDRVLTHPEFAWRMPREVSEQPQGTSPSLLTKFSQAVQGVAKACWTPCKRALQRFAHWLWKYFKPQHPDPETASPLEWKAAFERIVYGLCAVLLIAAAAVAWRAWKRRGIVPKAEAEPVHAVPDLRSEHITADQLPEDRWIELAEQLASQGEFRLSLRALYLAGLAHLGARELVTIARAKSNNEFCRELNRRARSQPELLSAFGESVKVFECVWYGNGEATPESVEHYGANLQRIRSC